MQEDRPWRIPQMSTARGRDGGRTQSGGVKGVIAPDPDDDPDFYAARHLLSFLFRLTRLACIVLSRFSLPFFLFYFFFVHIQSIICAQPCISFWLAGNCSVCV